MRHVIEECLDGTFEVTINYKDNSGNASTRRVRVVTMETTSFRAFCLLRNEFRSFRYDRIQGGFKHPRSRYDLDELLMLLDSNPGI